MFLHYIESSINAGAVAMVVGLVMVPLVSILSPKLSKSHIEQVFSCYDDLVEATTRKVLPNDSSFDSPAFRKKKKGH